MATMREARAIWEGDLAKGSGEVTAVSSARFSGLPISWPARTGEPGGKTSPEELLAAAHASCFAMALSAGLAKNGMRPQRLEVTATVTFDKVGDAWTVTSSELAVTGTVPDADQESFAQAAETRRRPVRSAVRSRGTSRFACGQRSRRDQRRGPDRRTIRRESCALRGRNAPCCIARPDGQGNRSRCCRSIRGAHADREACHRRWRGSGPYRAILSERPGIRLWRLRRDLRYQRDRCRSRCQRCDYRGLRVRARCLLLRHGVQDRAAGMRSL